MQYGMPTLIENKTLNDNIKLCKELGLKFIELNMNFPEYQIDKLEKVLGIKDLDEIVTPEATIRELELDDTIINSCKTDIEVLRATAGIVGLLLSSNQYVAVRF